MKPVHLIITILAAGAIGGTIVGLMTGGLPTWLRPSLSEGEERQRCEAAIHARGIDTSSAISSPIANRSQWPHYVEFLIPGHTASCRFFRDGTMITDIL